MSLITGVVVTLLAVAMASQLAKVVENRELISYMIQRRKR
jgi:hypothetical protein